MQGRNSLCLCYVFLACVPIPVQKPSNFRWAVSGFATVDIGVVWSLQFSWEENPGDIISES